MAFLGATYTLDEYSLVECGSQTTLLMPNLSTNSKELGMSVLDMSFDPVKGSSQDCLNALFKSVNLL
jgi:hypothetical protein